MKGVPYCPIGDDMAGAPGTRLDEDRSAPVCESDPEGSPPVHMPQGHGAGALPVRPAGPESHCRKPRAGDAVPGREAVPGTMAWTRCTTGYGAAGPGSPVSVAGISPARGRAARALATFERVGRPRAEQMNVPASTRRGRSTPVAMPSPSSM